MTLGRTIASSRTQAGMLSTWLRLRSSWPAWVPAGPSACMRVKCSDTPDGVSSAISGSTVGLPGGTRNPIRVRHPFMIAARSCLLFPRDASSMIAFRDRGVKSQKPEPPDVPLHLRTMRRPVSRYAVAAAVVPGLRGRAAIRQLEGADLADAGRIGAALQAGVARRPRHSRHRRRAVVCDRPARAVAARAGWLRDVGLHSARDA